jgi:hypothetical protein
MVTASMVLGASATACSAVTARSRSSPCSRSFSMSCQSPRPVARHWRGRCARPRRGAAPPRRPERTGRPQPRSTTRSRPVNRNSDSRPAQATNARPANSLRSASRAPARQLPGGRYLPPRPDVVVPSTEQRAGPGGRMTGARRNEVRLTSGHGDPPKFGGGITSWPRPTPARWSGASPAAASRWPRLRPVRPTPARAGPRLGRTGR